MRLTVGSGPDSGTTVDVPPDGLLIGRGKDCDLVLDDKDASRNHASLMRLADGSARLIDLGSANGTLVDGRRIEGPVDLVGGEEIRIGQTLLSAQRTQQPAAPAEEDGVPLRVISGPAAGTTAAVTGDAFLVGRSPRCDLVLDDPKVSAEHAYLSALDGGHVGVVDAGSRNGTFVNGRQIHERAVVDSGGELRFGDTVVTVGARPDAGGAVASGPPELAPTVASRRPPPGDAPPAPDAAGPGPLFLRIGTGAEEGRIVAVTSERFLMGRAAGCDLVLADGKVSRQHAILTAHADRGAIVADLASRNGTSINGVRVETTGELRSGDVLELGPVELAFTDLREPPSGPGAPAQPSAASADGGASWSADGSAVLTPGRVVERTPPAFSTEALARRSSRRPWATIAIWALALVAALATVVLLFADALTSEGTVSGNPESKQADTLLEDRLRGPRRITEIVIVSSPTLTVDDPAFRRKVTSLYDDIRGLGRETVTGGRHFYQRRDPSLVSRDRHTTILPFVMAGDFEQASGEIGKVTDVVREADRDRRFRALINGETSVDADFEAVSEHDLKTGEVYGLAVALVVLVFVFSSLVAAAVPLLLALMSIGVALGLTALVGQAMDLSFFVTNMIVGMGLALGIDYSLFVLTRYREERALGRNRLDAIAAGGATSGRAVLFSGIAVVMALVGMLFVPDTVLRSLGVGAILAGSVSVVAALTMLPAILGLLGDRVNAGALPKRRRDGSQRRSVWVRIAEIVMRRPVVSLVISTAILLAAAIPVTELRTGTSGVSTLPDDRISKQGFLALERDFSAGEADPAEVVVDGPIGSAPVDRAIRRLRARVRRDPVLGAVPPPTVNRAKDLALLSVPVEADVQGERAIAAVRRLRSTYIPQAFENVDARVLVTGTTASQLDEEDAVNAARPYVIAFVLGISFLLLMLAFRSIVVPLKAIVMNLLSVGAAYGILVLVFQRGYGAEIFGFQQVDVVESWVPLFLFSVLFGLSMDYHVFLLSRIRESFNQTGRNREAVAHGVETTAPLITGAALIMVAVFGGFAAGDLVMFQQMGFGLAVALLLDATVVRSVLVPATMTLLGKRNWYLPSWLRWLPEIGVEGQGR